MLPPPSRPFRHSEALWQARQREPWQRQGLLPVAPAPGRAGSAKAPKLGLGRRGGSSEPHFLRAGSGEAESISCCAAETGGDVTAFTPSGISALGAPSSARSWAGRAAGAPWGREDSGCRGSAGGCGGAGAAFPRGPPGPAAPAPRGCRAPAGWSPRLLSLGEGKGVSFQALRGSTFLAQVS